MKKTTKILSSLLACIMIISALPVFASASEEIPKAFFCDFESITPIAAGNATTASELTSAGFKWVTTEKDAAKIKIVNDETYGNTLGFVGTGGIGMAFDAPVTTGKVRFGFSFKAGLFAYIRPIGTLGSAQSTAGTNIEVDGEKIMYLAQVTNNSFDVMKGPDYSAKEKSESLTTGEWSYIEIVVDLDNNSWSGYLNGNLVATTTRPLTSANSLDPLPQLQGIYFYNGNNGDRTGLVDNVVMSYEPAGSENVSILATDYSLDEDGGQIDIVFSEAMKPSASVDDINFVKCGSSYSVTVSDVSVLDNKMTIIYSGALDEGCEYAVTFGDGVETLGGKGVTDAAYIYRKPESQNVIYYAGSEDAAEGFDDTTGYTTFSGSLGTRMQVNNTDYLNAFHMQTESLTGDNAYVAYVNRADCSFTPPEGTTDYALSPFSSSKAYRLLDMIPGDSGIETYEFEVKNIGDSPFKLYALINDEYTDDYTNESYGWQIASMSKNNNWRKIKLVYDTETQLLEFYSDGSFVRSKVMSKGFSVPLVFTSPSVGAANNTLMFDNYRSYVTRTPLSVTKVRYKDASGNVTGLNTISPETTSIDITFSEPVEYEALEDITVTGTGSPDNHVTDVELSEDGMTATLSISGMLSGDSDFALTIPVCDRVYNFQTTDGRFAVENFAATTGGGYELTFGTTPAGGDSIKLSGEIINTVGKGTRYTLIYGYYNDDMLVAMDSNDYVIDNETYFDSVEWTATVPGGIEYDTVRIFVWNSIDGMEALADCQVYSE